ncbi:MAG TPA: hypothetical protein VGB50_13160 [Flavobacterium sp.]|jgi:hypothetical protein
MKKIAFALFAAFLMIGCDVGEDRPTVVVIGPVEDVTMASTYKVDSVSKIMIRYKRPSDCHIFNGFYYTAEDFQRNVAVQFAKLDEPNCQPDDTEYEIPLNFKPTAAGTYTFKFWNGRETDGTDTFIETEAIVGQ